MESTDISWADDVRYLAASAKLVVIDISQRTPGLSEEIEMLSEPGIDKKIIQIQETTESEVTGGVCSALQGDVIFLAKSPMMRRLSQALGFTFTYAGFLIMTGTGVSLVDPKWSSKIGTLILWASLLYSVLPGIWSASALAPSAGFTRQSSNNIDLTPL